MDYDDKDYTDGGETVTFTDSETGEAYYRHPLTGKKIYVEDEA